MPSILILFVSLLLKVSQYTFAMCSYREKKSEPQELLQLDGYTVDYTDPQPGKTLTFTDYSYVPLLYGTIITFWLSKR